MVKLFKQSCAAIYGAAKCCLIYCLKLAVRKLQSTSKYVPPLPPPPTHKSRPSGPPAIRPHPPTRPSSQAAFRPPGHGHPATRPRPSGHTTIRNYDITTLPYYDITSLPHHLNTSSLRFREVLGAYHFIVVKLKSNILISVKCGGQPKILRKKYLNP